MRQIKIVNFLFSHCKSMETIICHSNQSSYPIGTKTQLFVPLPIEVIEKQLTGTGAIKRQIPLLKPKREINKYYK